MNELEGLIFISAIFIAIFILIIVAMELHTYFSNKIHKSFHKGYDKAKSDKVQYYSTLKILTDDFKEIILNLEKDNIKPSIITTSLLINFKESLEKYYNN